MVKRIAFKTPGYDCLHAPCQHEKKGEHGISGGSYLWAVKTRDMALELSLSAHEYPSTVPAEKVEPMLRFAAERVREGRITGSLSVHATFPTDPEMLLTDSARRGTENCKLLAPRHCFIIWDSYVAADEAVPLLDLSPRGLPSFEQGGRLWGWLVHKLEDLAPKLRAQRADRLWRVCPRCHGERFLKRRRRT